MIQSINSPAFNIGDVVKVIDIDEFPNEWANFRVISSSGTTYQLAPLDRFFLYKKPLHVTSSEIVSDS